jgi:hypothetical protein
MKIDNVVKRGSDGLLVLVEEYMDLSALDDDAIRALRGVMVEKSSAVTEAFAALGDDRYSSAEGNEMLRDLNYYSECIRRIEYEMQGRMLTLDADDDGDE